MKNLAPLRVRRYRDLERRLRAHQAHVFGHAHGYALYCFQHSPPPAVGAVVHLLISGGIHGDEPAGVETLMRLIEAPPRWTKNIHLILFPCLNPWGYEHHTRTNADGIDLNRQFRAQKPPPEVAAYLKAIAGQSFDLAVALHEDYDGTGFYLYELSRREKALGPRIIQRIRTIMPIHASSQIEGLRCKNGVIAPQINRLAVFRRQQWPEAIYLYRQQCPHSITTETPSGLPLARRVRAQLAALQTAAENLPSPVS